MLDHKESLGKFARTEITQHMLSENSGIKPRVNKTNIIRKSSNIHKLNNILQNN